MKEKWFFLVGLPLVWLAVAVLSHHRLADKAYWFSIAPSVWLLVFRNWNLLTIHQLQMAGLPVVILIGAVLYWLKMKPKAAVISSLVLTFIFWISLMICGSQGTLIREPGAIFVWLLCCFNLSLCFLPFAAVGICIFHVTRSYRNTTNERGIKP